MALMCVCTQHCDAGLRFLHQAFITLHIGLNARERDLARELQMTRYTAGIRQSPMNAITICHLFCHDSTTHICIPHTVHAGTILQHRHSTATVLRQLGERADELEEAQLHELKKQIKVCTQRTCISSYSRVIGGFFISDINIKICVLWRLQVMIIIIRMLPIARPQSLRVFRSKS